MGRMMVSHIDTTPERSGNGFTSLRSASRSNTMQQSTPRKRKAQHNEHTSSSSQQQQQPQLVNAQGRASIGMGGASTSNALLDHDGDLAITSTRLQSQFAISTKPACTDLLAAFDTQEPVPGGSSTLIAVEVPNMGRMIVHRAEALQIHGLMASVSQPSDSQSSASSSDSSAGLSIESRASSSTTVSHTGDPSPRLPLDARFVSNSTSGKQAGIASSATIVDIMRHATAGLRRDGKRSPQGLPLLLDTSSTISACKPSLEGDGMPSLDWPDSAQGPWAAASNPMERQQKRKKQAIARWLDEESDKDTPIEPQSQHHPMVAKVLMDRRRQEATIRALAIASQADCTPCKIKRKSKHGSALLTPSTRRNKMRKATLSTSHLHASSSALSTPIKDTTGTAQIGCQCGRNDDGTPMIFCDSCSMWFHMGCVGMTDSSGLGEEWFCLMCCEAATTVLTPSSLSSGLAVTPSFPRSAALAGQRLRLSQGQLPVFSHPVDTPHNRRDDGHAHPFSSVLALAPSPVVMSSVERRSSQVGGRARASRMGWHLAEPGSPLERKSGYSHRRNLSGSGTAPFSPGSRQGRTFGLSESGHDLYGASLGTAASQAVPTTTAAPADNLSAYLRTPSPRMMSATPQRIRTSSNYSVRGAVGTSTHRRETSGLRDFDDVFSTPSRILHGSSGWGQASTTSMLRHSREESGLSASATAAQNTPWGLSTPTRHLMDAGFNSDYSGPGGGLPSLVHSSGGLDIGEFAGWHHLQNSPTSSTRAAARARQQSNGNGAAGARRIDTSFMRETTPERSSGFDANSSSPFPKTPTFSMDPYHPVDSHGPHGHDDLAYSPSSAAQLRANGFMPASRKLGSLTHGQALSPMGSPSRAHARRGHGRSAKSHNGSSGSEQSGSLTSLQGPVELRASRNGGHGPAQSKPSNAHQHAAKARTRNPSTDLMAGLGIGLDLNDVIDWM